ncbi:MAG: hypothetical protein AUJ98_10780 [Bacteroidetes bacterium CG2_30_33_31]|nr:MAG: hypothetical protein AUJ98_10780 [Bacteroidetes bacterium CG2_30_33_31]
MAGYKETPRQKMIGMMYLFYTALLALNVSVEILNAFVIVNEGMERTVANFGSKNAILYSDFEKQFEMNKAKVAPFWEATKETRTLSDNLIAQLETVKNQVIGYTEFGDKNAKNVLYKMKNDKGHEVEIKAPLPSDVPLEWINSKDNYNKPMEILLGVLKEDGTSGEATKIKKAFADYTNNIMKLLKGDTIGLNLGLNTEDKYNSRAGIRQNWEMNTFHQTVLAADIVLLNKYISDVRNIEFEVVKRLYSQISSRDFKFDKIAAKVVPHANIVISGQEYAADIFVAAYSTTDTPQVILKPGLDSNSIKKIDLNNAGGVTRINKVNNGVVEYTVKTGATGEFTYAGIINVKQPDGTLKAYPFSSSYNVIKPTATVSADKMNVVYRGLSNPMSVSAPGFTNENVSLSSSGGGTLARTSPGHYFFTPSKDSKAKDVTFFVSAKSGKGSQRLGEFKYRIKNLPPPTITLAGKVDGETVSKTVVLASPYLRAQLLDFLFDGVSYNVTSFEFYASHPIKGKIALETVKGSSLNATIIAALRKAPAGTRVSISSVNVVGPDGGKRASGLNIILN